MEMKGGGGGGEGGEEKGKVMGREGGRRDSGEGVETEGSMLQQDDRAGEGLWEVGRPE